MDRIQLFAIVLLLALISSAQAQCLSWAYGPGQECPGPWPGPNAVQATVIWDRDGPGGQPSGVVAAGTFVAAGSAVCNNIAFWDGAAWSALGAGFNSGVYSVCVFNNELYAAGSFTASGSTACASIARWDSPTQQWLPVGSGTDGGIQTLAVFNGRLYAAGSFLHAGGVAASHIAAWTGSAWTSLGSGISGGNSQVFAMAPYNGSLYIGGDFTVGGGVASNDLVRWNGSSFAAVAASNTVRALVPWSSIDGSVNYLFAGGYFTTVAGVSAGRLARLDGTTWSAQGALPNTGAVVAIYPRTIGVSGLDLYAAFNDSPAGVYRYSGGVWSAYGDSTHCDALLLYGFQIVGGRSDGLFRWDGTYWRPYGNGISGRINAAASWNGGLYFAGSFKFADQQVVSNIVRWDGAAFSPLSSGMDGDVSALAVYQNQLFAGGTFSHAGGVSTTAIARWNGSAWQSTPGAPSPTLALLAAPDGFLYACSGWSGSTSAVYRWTGISWQQIGPFIPAPINSLAWYNGALHTAGANVYRLDGSTWTSIYQGAYGTEGLTAFGPDLVWLYATDLTHLGVRAWNGSFWRDLQPPTLAVGGGALAVHGGQLYAALGGNIYSWSGTIWNSVASANGGIATMIDHNSELIVAGSFSTAGGRVSHPWARLGACCGSADFNCDGDLGTDADIETFFACLAGNCPPAPCTSTADFNSDGDLGTDADIEAFFRVLAGGTC